MVPNPFDVYRLTTGRFLRPKEVKSHMAKTDKGKKVVPVKPYSYKRNGKTVRVKRHKRSTPN